MTQINAGRVRFASRGEYNNTTQYYLFDLVNYNGNSYYAKENTLGNLPTDTSKWQLIAEKGNIGPTGQTGATGNGIASIVKTSTSGLVDTYTITFTNGSTTTFEITNGEDGEVTQEQLDETNAMNELLLDQIPKGTATGQDITINDSSNLPIKSIEISGNTSQETTSISGGDEYDSPSPDHPQPIHIVKGNNSIVEEGKNLIYSIAKSGNTLLFNGNSETDYTFKAGTYTFSYTKNTSSNISLFKRTATTSSTNIGTETQVTFTSNEDFNIWLYRSGIELTDASEIMLEKDSTATTYEPYTSTTYLLTLPNGMELCKKSTYEDSFIKQNGNWYLKKKIGKYQFTGNEEYTQYSTTNKFHTLLNDALFDSGVTILCNKYLGKPSGGGNSDYDNYTCWLQNTSDYKRIYFRNDSCNNASDFQLEMQSETPIVYYPLATPEYIPLNNTLQEQLDAIWNMKTNKNVTNISITADDLKPYLDIVYRKDLETLLGE